MDTEKKIQLKRELGYFWGVNFLIVNIIGAGIFVAPKGVLQYSSMNVGVSLCIWAVCAVLSMTSALCFSEIGIAFPYTGAHYYFIKRCFSPSIAFLRLWTSLFLSPGVIASQALLLAEYGIQPFYPSCSSPNLPKKCLALAALWIVGILNSRGVKELSWLQTVSTALKMGILGFISLSGVVMLVKGKKENVGRLQNAFDGEFPEISQIIEAVFQGYFAFSGGGCLTYVAAVFLNVSLGSLAIVLTNLIELINYLYFASSIWTLLCMIGILKLRYQEPNLHRPYKVVITISNQHVLMTISTHEDSPELPFIVVLSPEHIDRTQKLA
ncbi:hypothetical protein ACRRTK_021621 [Alexandromys fortis]